MELTFGGGVIANHAPTRQIFDGVFIDRDERLYTKNLVPGASVYGETRVRDDRDTTVEYRHWHPHRSKLAAMVLKGCENFPIRPGSKVLYLGAANGTTVSHVSDIIMEGIVYAV